MAATDARPVPRKNEAFRYYFGLRNISTGALITAWAGADSEVSKDGGAFADCTNESTEIGASGCGFIDLTATEMNADAVILKITFTNPSSVPYVVTFFPEESGDYRADVTLISGDSAAADNAEAFFDGTGYAGTNNVIPQVTTTTNLTNKGDGSGFTAIPWNAAWDAEVQSEVQDGIEANNLDHLVKIAVDTNFATTVHLDSVLGHIADNGTAASFDRTTDSLEAIRDRGDAAWTTGGGGSLSDILNVQPLIPYSIDVANTATYRIGLMLFNALDDLPSTSEITPGTISIDRKAIGGTTWSAVITDQACSESAGLIYYDATFNAGSGYAEGDSLRITFKSQKITVAANDYEITDGTGRMFYTELRQTERGTNNASTLDAAAVRAAIGMAVANLDTQLADIDNYIDTEIATLITNTANIEADTQDIQSRLPAALVAGRMDSSTGAMSANTLTASALANDAVSEIQTGLATAASIAALNNLSSAQVLAEVQSGIVNNHLDHLLAVDYDPANKPGVATALLNELVESDGGVSRYTANALEQAPSGGGGGGGAAYVVLPGSVRNKQSALGHIMEIHRGEYGSTLFRDMFEEDGVTPMNLAGRTIHVYYRDLAANTAIADYAATVTTSPAFPAVTHRITWIMPAALSSTLIGNPSLGWSFRDITGGTVDLVLSRGQLKVLDVA